MKIIPWSLPLPRLGKSLPRTRTLKLEILCLFSVTVLSVISRRDDTGGKAFQHYMDVPSPPVGLEKALTLCSWPGEELILLDLEKTCLTWICLLRNDENLRVLKVPLCTSIKGFIIVEGTKLKCSLQTPKAAVVF